MAAEGSKESPWKLKTPPGTSDYEMHRDVKNGRAFIPSVAGKTTILYDAACLSDLHEMLNRHGDSMGLGSADEQKPAKTGAIEASGRPADNPIGGWYRLKKGLRGRFGLYIPPLMETLSFAALTHEPRGNKMRAI